MAVESCSGISFLQLAAQTAQSEALCGRACIFGCLAIFCQTADIAYGYRVRILSEAMGTLSGFGAAGMDGAVKIYHIVIAYAVESTGTMPAVDFFYCHLSAFGRSCAMQYYFIYVSHTQHKV